MKRSESIRVLMKERRLFTFSTFLERYTNYSLV